MDTARLLRQWIVIEQVTQNGAPDAMGDPTEEKTYLRLRGYVWQTGASEQTANEQIESESWELALDRSAAGQIFAGDRIYPDAELDVDGNLVEPAGQAFDIAGPPWPALNPRTKLVEYVHARLARSA